MKRKEIESFTNQWCKQKNMPNAQLFHDFANDIYDHIHHEDNGNAFVNVLIKIVRIFILCGLVYVFFGLANWNGHIGQWKEHHRELACAIGGIGTVLIATTNKKNHDPEEPEEK